MARELITLGWKRNGAAAERLDDFIESKQEVERAAKPVVQIRLAAHSVDAWVKPDPLEYCLDCWKAWMAGDADRDLGAKTMRGLIGNTDGHGVDLYEAQQEHDNRIAAATDAMIESLPRIQVWAIYKSCSIGTVWQFPNADLVEVAAQARAALAEKLRKNVCTATLF